MTGPLSTFIAGRAGTEYTSQSLVDLRERLILRWNAPRRPHPTPRDGQIPEPRPATPLDGEAGPRTETVGEA